MKVGVGLKPGTAVEAVEEWVDQGLVDMVLVMTVEPGPELVVVELVMLVVVSMVVVVVVGMVVTVPQGSAASRSWLL